MKSPCPWCGRVDDVTGSADVVMSSDTAISEPGAVAVCYACAHPVIFDADLILRRPLPGELEPRTEEDREMVKRLIERGEH